MAWLFSGNDIDELFLSHQEMVIFLLFALPVSISMSCLAMLEAARRNGRLDLQFGRQLLHALAEGSSILQEGAPSSKVSEKVILCSLI